MTCRLSHRIRASRHVPLALLAALALSLPAASVADVGQYARDRAHDFLDIFRFRLGVPNKGRGIGVKARVTAVAQLGYVYFDGHYLGMDRRSLGLMRERRSEGGISLAYGSRNRMQDVDGNYFIDSDTEWMTVEDRRIIRNLPYWDDGRGDLLGVGAEIVTPIFALDMGVYPSQFIDFLTGFVTIDPFRDDGLTMRRRVGTWAPISPTEWGPDPEAPTRRENERIRNTRARIERTELERSGAIAPETAPAPAPPVVRPTAPPVAPIVEPEETVDEATLEQIDREATPIDYDPVLIMTPEEPEVIEDLSEPQPEVEEVIPEPEIDEPVVEPASEPADEPADEPQAPATDESETPEEP